ncbi:WGxxGxxG family protein [Deinococcus sp. Leaf326]|uniref:WGxxGxxG family protein n=1 Tax=Deinococcus sp. Leaf326 TaxID=1736338 RepID=UPI0009EB70F0|nr:WGxxGxxG family protein [Deinococcus sp. Leaf326]
MKQETKTVLLVLTLGLTSVPALAQGNTTGTTTLGTTTTDTTTRDDNNGMDWGWLGLLGLAGLAGLRRKEPVVVRHDQTTTHR